MMMVLSALRPDASLPEFLAHRAKSASVRRLSIDLAVGLAGLWAALHWRPAAWLVVASLSLIFFAYGGWGIADRARSGAARQTRRLPRTLWDALCFLLATAGVLATAGLLYSVWAVALGTWIS
jgi:amino acid transporter